MLGCYDFFRLLPAITQFKDGLGEVWIAFIRNEEIMTELFTHSEKGLDCNAFRALYTIDWSADGNKKREEEDDTIFSWESLLRDCEGF